MAELIKYQTLTVLRRRLNNLTQVGWRQAWTKLRKIKGI